MSQPKNNDNRHQPATVKDNHRLSDDLRIAYQQIYEIHDAHQETIRQLQQAQSDLTQLKQKFGGQYPPGTGPIDTLILGLPVQPIDTNTLADGTTIKWNKKSGSFIVS